MIKTFSDETAAAYLAAFIDGEGHVGCHRTSQGYWSRSISFCNTEKELFDTAVAISRQLGFRTTVQHGVSPKQGHSERWIAYVARSREEFDAFAKLVPIQSPKKRAALQQIFESYKDPEETRKARRTGTTNPCETCGKPVYSCAAIQARGGGRFCSTECRGKAAQNRVSLVCEQCGRDYEVIRAYSVRSRFCSSRCCGLSKSDRMRNMAKMAADARWRR